jgi:hypothetical protein
MTAPLVRGPYQVPTDQSEQFASLSKDVLNRNGYGGLHDIFGTPPPSAYQTINALNQGIPIDGKTIPEMYAGRNTKIADTLTLEMRNLQGPLFQLCPLEKTDDIGKRTVYKTKHKQTVLSPVGTYGLVRHMNFRRTQESFELLSYGLGFQMELQTLLKPEGQGLFNDYVTMIGTATLLTGEILIMSALVGCFEAAKMMDLFFPETAGSLADLIDVWTNLAFAIHKSGNGIQQTMGWIKRIRQSMRVSDPDMLLVPPATAEQLALGNPESRQYMIAGPEAMRVRSEGAPFYSQVHGIPLVEIKPESIGDTNSGPYDPLERAIELGLFYVSGANPRFSSKIPYDSVSRDIAIFSMANNGNRIVITLKQMIHGDIAFDAASGHLNEPVLSALAQDYEQICRAKQLSLHVSSNQDPLVDPNIYFDENRVGQVVQYFGDIDPAYMSENFITSLAHVNHLALQRKLGKDTMSDIRGMLEVLDESARYSISPTTNQASAIEAFAAAVALDYRNRRSTDGSRASGGQTPGNSFGADFLPPLDRDGHFATFINEGEIRTIDFMSSPALRAELAPANRTEGFYAAHGSMEAGFGYNATHVPAPAFPPGCSGPNWAAYISASMSSGDPGIRTWIEKRPESRVKFEKVAKGWRAFKTYFAEQHTVFSLTKDKVAENPLMDPDSCPSYMAPSTNDEYLRAEFAYFQQVFIGMRGPLAVGYVFPGAVGVGASAFSIKSLSAATVYNLSQSGSRSSSMSEREATILADSISRGIVQNMSSTSTEAKKLAEQSAAALILLIDGEPTLKPDLVNAIKDNESARFREVITEAMDRAGTRSPIVIPAGLSSADDKIAIFLNAAIPAFGSADNSVVDLVKANKTRQAADYLNQVWSILNEGRNVALNSKNVKVAAERVLNAIIDNDGAFSDSHVSTVRTAQLSSGLSEYSDEIGKRVGEYGAPYVVTRLQVKHGRGGGLYDGVSSDRAFQSILRPVSFQNNARVIAPFNMSKDTGVPVTTLSGTESGASLNSFAKDINKALGPMSKEYKNGGSLQKFAHNLRTKGRTEAYVDRSKSSMTAMHLSRAFGGSGDTLGLGPVGYYLSDEPSSHEHGGAQAFDSPSAFGRSSKGQKRQSDTDYDYGSSSSSSYGSKRVLGGAGYSVNSSAGLRHDDYYPSSLSDMRERITRDADQSDPMADLVFYGNLMEASRWIITRLAVLGHMFVDPLERAMAVTFLMTPVHRDIIMNMANYNYVVPRSYLLVQPFIRLNVHSAYAVSSNIGKTYYAYPNVSVGFDANTLNCTARFSTKLGVVITDSDSITCDTLFSFNSYCGGAEGRIVAPSDIYNSTTSSAYGSSRKFAYDPANYTRSTADLFVVGVGCDSPSFGDELPLTGFYRAATINRQLSEEAAAGLMRMQWPAALYADELCNWSRIGSNQGNFSTTTSKDHMLNDMLAPLSSSRGGRMLFQGPQNNYNPTQGDYSHVYSAGAGPLGALRPGCGSVLKGQVGMICYMEKQQIVSQPLAIQN